MEGKNENNGLIRATPIIPVVHFRNCKCNKCIKNRKIKESDLWTTPEWLMTTFMEKCYDPCPSGREEWFNGLEVAWKSPAYVNPPYSEPELWIDKAIEQQNKGVNVVMLLRVDPSTKWYKKLAEAGAHFAYLNERIYFSGTSGSKRPNFASMLVFLEGFNGTEKNR